MNEVLRQDVMEVIEHTSHTIAAACQEVEVSRSNFYRWQRCRDGAAPTERLAWNGLLETKRDAILREAKQKPELSARKLAYWLIDHRFLSVLEASVQRLLRAQGLLPRQAPELAPAAKEFRYKTKRPNELWQNDATRFFVPGWGHY